jgi:integrase
MVLFAYRHGMRASEVCNVRLDDIDLERQAITVRRLKGSLDTVQPLYPHRGLPCSTSWRRFAHISVIVTPMVKIPCSCPRKAAGFTVRSSSGCSRRLPSLWGCLQTIAIFTF